MASQLSIVVTGTNRHDVKQLPEVLGGQSYWAPTGDWRDTPVFVRWCRLYGQAGTTKDWGVRLWSSCLLASRGRQRQGEVPDYCPRCWVVEVYHCWFNRFRKLRVHCEEERPKLPRIAEARLGYHRLSKGARTDNMDNFLVGF